LQRIAHGLIVIDHIHRAFFRNQAHKILSNTLNNDLDDKNHGWSARNLDSLLFI
jgi:hypothetical protein